MHRLARVRLPRSDRNLRIRRPSSDHFRCLRFYSSVPPKDPVGEDGTPSQAGPSREGSVQEGSIQEGSSEEKLMATGEGLEVSSHEVPQEIPTQGTSSQEMSSEQNIMPSGDGLEASHEIQLDKIPAQGVSSREVSPEETTGEQLENTQKSMESADNTQHNRGSGKYPNLLTWEPLYDFYDSEEFPPTRNSPYRNKVIIRNDPSMFEAAQEYEAAQAARGQPEPTEEELIKAQEEAEKEEEEEEEEMPRSPYAYSGRVVHKYVLFQRRVLQQTGKGKIQRMAALVVVGNGDGLVGYGEGKDDEAPRAIEKAETEAKRNMDWVERFERRTIWTELHTKLGGTQIILRPRPVGFGLACNPNVHQVLKAAGIKDASAKVWGSRNPLNVIKATFRMLQAGNAPLSMGDGVGGGGRKLDKGTGVRGRSDVERERGRKLIDQRTW